MARRDLALISIVFVLAISCGKDEPQGRPKPRNPEIVSFEASASEVASGTAVRISWQTRNAEAIELSASGTLVDVGDASPAEGSVEVEVAETTEFRLATISGDRRIEADPITVAVVAPRILSFTASPPVIEEGEAVTLSWKREFATAVEIRDAAGNAVDIGDAPPSEGEVTVVPTASTTYALKASAGALSAEAQASVQIRGAPGLEISASPAEIRHGDSVRLAWTTTEAEILRIERDGQLVHESSEPSGQLVDSPERTATYVFTASRGPKSTVLSRTVAVRPVIYAFTAPQTPAPVGAEVLVSWRVGGARELVVSNGAGFEQVLEVEPCSEASLSVPMDPEGRFALVARSGDYEESATAETPVLPPRRSAPSPSPPRS